MLVPNRMTPHRIDAALGWGKDPAERRRRKPVGRRRNKRMALPEPDPTSEELAYAEAQKMANKRSSFFGHMTIWLMVWFFLLVTAGWFAAMVVAVAWGIGLASHGYYAVIAPELRRRWTEEEVGRRLHRTVTDERVNMEGKHARSLQQLSASIAHEIRNPITAAKSLVQQIEEEPNAPENIEYAKVALEELDRVERSISHLLRYARDEEMRPQVVEIADVVDSALETFRDRLARDAVRIERDLAAGSNIEGDPEKLRRVVINLVGNALDAIAEVPPSDPCVRISSGHNLAGTELWVRVKDNGPGIDAPRLREIFSPFHTSKSNGTGLGLAITKKAVEAHGGTIEVESQVGVGTELVVVFPAGGAPKELTA